MMRCSDMEDLIKRLEEATEGSRELDAEIALLVGYTHERQSRERRPWWRDPQGRRIGFDSWSDRPPPFSTSLDAKLPWENIVEMAWHETVPGEPLGEVCEAWHLNRETGKRAMGAGHTEPLARRIAALKARSHEA